MIEKRWITRPVDQEQILALADSMALSPITAKVLWGRGVTDSGQARSWLTDSGWNGHDPFLLPDMEKCVDRLQQAIHQESVPSRKTLAIVATSRKLPGASLRRLMGWPLTFSR